jgi:hypothetical protein
MRSRDSEDVERREMSRLAARFYIELRADAPKEFCRTAFRGRHPGQKKKIARLHSFRIGSKWLRRRPWSSMCSFLNRCSALAGRELARVIGFVFGFAFMGDPSG